MLENAVSTLSLPWVGAVLGLLGVALAVVFYIRSKRNPKLAYQTSEFSVVGIEARFPDELEIRFAGTHVNRVTSSRLVLWNAGNTTLNGEQIVAADPLRIEVPDGLILRATIAQSTRNVNGGQLIMPNDRHDSVLLSFDYFDPADGFAVEVIHTGPRGDLRCCGTVKELPNGITRLGAPRQSGLEGALLNTLFKMKYIPFIIMIITGCTVFFAGIFAEQISPFLNAIDPTFKVRTGPSWAMTLMGAVYAFPPMIWLWLSRRRYPVKLQEPTSENCEQQSQTSLDLQLA